MAILFVLSPALPTHTHTHTHTYSLSLSLTLSLSQVDHAESERLLSLNIEELKGQLSEKGAEVIKLEARISHLEKQLEKTEGDLDAAKRLGDHR